MDRLNEISSNQIPVSGEYLLHNLLDAASESFHGFDDTEIRSALKHELGDKGGVAVMDYLGIKCGYFPYFLTFHLRVLFLFQVLRKGT